jgi:hypothetical protein
MNSVSVIVYSEWVRVSAIARSEPLACIHFDRDVIILCARWCRWSCGMCIARSAVNRRRRRALERRFVETDVYKIIPLAIVAQAIRACPASNNRKRVSHCGIHFEFSQHHFSSRENMFCIAKKHAYLIEK